MGGLLAGGFALLATKKAHDHALQRREREEDDLVRALLQSLHDELETLWDRYHRGMGVQLEALQDGQPCLLYFLANQDYFTVYRQNSHLLGKISGADLRKAIIVTYTQAKGILDSYSLNNHFIQEYERLLYLFQETGQQIHQQNANALLQVLTKMALQLKAAHNELKEQVEEVLQKLRKTGRLHDIP